MSTEEQSTAIGSVTMEEYSACKRKLAELQVDAIQTWDRLARIGSLLSSSPLSPVEDVGEVVAAINHATRDFPTVDYIRNLAEQIKTEIERKQRLHAALKNMGVEPNDY